MSKKAKGAFDMHFGRAAASAALIMAISAGAALADTGMYAVYSSSDREVTERIRIAAKRRMFANAKSVGADKIVANNQKSANAKTGGAEPRPYGVNKDCGKKANVAISKKHIC